MNLEKIIEIKNLKKSFEFIKAVDGISFDVFKNEIFGIVGPDGAGKTTTIRILCGLLIPDEGIISIIGYDIFKQIKKIRKEIGYLSQKFSLYADLTVDENIEFFADIHSVKNYKNKRDELLKFMRLLNFRNFRAGKLSGGMKQKLALACTLIHTPQIIFLDEPTTGVDPVSRRDFWRILSSLLKDGITVLLSTPYLDEAERFDRIVFLNNGKILKCDTPANIKKSMNKQIIELVTPATRESYKLIKSNTRYEVQIFGDRIDIVVENFERDLKTVQKLLVNNNIEILDYRKKSVSLENVFINLLEHQSLN